MWLTNGLLIAWGIFWLYWLFAAIGSKRSSSSRSRPLALVVILAVLLLRLLRINGFVLHSLAAQVVGIVLFVCGLALAVSARIYLGRNWGMPMTEKDEPELVTSGPYRFVRHPIYSGLLLAILGTALATNLYWLTALPVLGMYFLYSALVEERLMTAAFPAAYPSYRARTKMLVPFLL
jgi:protein-S-isoprenylcysteine O-methyltransferase Ste14